MKERINRNRLRIIFVIVAVCLLCASALTTVTLAANVSYAPNVSSYQLDEGAEYSYSSGNAVSQFCYGKNSLGSVIVSGNVDKVDSFRNVQAYGVTDNVTISYKYDGSFQNGNKTDWNIKSDSQKKVKGISLNSKIKTGALIVEKSSDNQTWNKISEYTDVFAVNKSGISELVKTSTADINAGVYYRITVAYAMTKVVQEKGWSWDWHFWPEDTYETHECVEVYLFYICNDKNQVVLRDIITRNEIKDKSQAQYGFSIDKMGSSYRVDVTNNGKTYSNVADGFTFTEIGKYEVQITSKFGDIFSYSVSVTDGLGMIPISPTVYKTNDTYAEKESIGKSKTVFGGTSMTSLMLTQKNGYEITAADHNGVSAYGVNGDNFWIFMKLNYEQSLTGNGWTLSSDSYGTYENETIDGSQTGKVEKGALIVQTSSDGKNWVNADKSKYANGVYTTNFAGNYSANNNILVYTPSGEEIIKGLYVRVLFFYEVINSGNKNTQNYCEEYNFFLCNDNLDAVTFHNLSVAETVQNMISNEDQITADMYRRAETLIDGSLTLSGFEIDTSLNASVTCEVYKNDVFLSGHSNRFTESGKYDITLKSCVGTQKRLTIYVDNDPAEKAFIKYFGSSLLTSESKRVFDKKPYPVFEGGKVEYHINTVPKDTLPLSGSIKNITTGKEENILPTKTEKRSVITEPGEYVVTLTNNSTHLSDSPCGDAIIFSFHFYVIPEGTAPGPQANKKSLAEYSHKAISDAKPVYYGLTYSSAASGNITLAFASREDAYNYAYNYEKGIVEKQPDGTFRYTGSFNVAQKEKINSAWDLADALDYFANQAIQELYFDLSDDFTYTTLDKEHLPADVNYRTYELSKSVVVFADGQQDKLTGMNGLPIISPKPYIFLDPQKGGTTQKGYSDFQFVKDKYEIDSQTVVIRDANGKEYTIEYEKNVGEQLTSFGCPSGIVTIIEKNKYDEKTEYPAVFISENDNSAKITISANIDGEVKQNTLDKTSADHLFVDAFTVDDISDLLDNYVLLLVIKDDVVIKQYVSDTLDGSMFSEPGEYTLKCVNRLGYAFSYSLTVNADTEFYVTISFSGDGMENEKPMIAYYGQKNVSLPSAERYGYRLIGFMDSFGTVYNDEINQILGKGEMLLEAIWQAKQYTAQFVDKNGRIVNTMTVDFGTEITLPTFVSETEFLGWSHNDKKVDDTHFTISEEGNLLFVAIEKEAEQQPSDSGDSTDDPQSGDDTQESENTGENKQISIFDNKVIVYGGGITCAVIILLVVVLAISGKSKRKKEQDKQESEETTNE